MLAKHISTDPMHRMSTRYNFGSWLDMRYDSVECFIGNADGVFRVCEIRRLEPQSRWDQEVIKNVIGVPWGTTDGRWTVDRPGIRVDPIPVPPLPFEGVRVQRESSTKQDVNEVGATVGCPGCNAIKDNKRAQTHPDLRREEFPGIAPPGTTPPRKGGEKHGKRRC